jgi:hypothetical protein
MKYGNKKLFLPLLFIVLAISLLLVLAAKSLAQSPSSYDVTVSPIFFDLITDPGGTIADKVRVRNNTSSPIPIKLGLEKLTGDINGNLALKQDKNDYTLSWVKFSQNTFVAKPLEWTEIPFTVNVPKDAAFGYYWAITFTQDVTSPLAKTGVSLTGAAGVPILLNVRKEGAVTKGKLVSLSVGPNFYEYLPVKFLIKFENTGNIHIRPHGNIFVKDWLGRQLAMLDVNQGQGAILPSAARVFDTTWDDSFITIEPKMELGQPKLGKNGKVETSLKIRWDKLLDLRIGRYTATALLVVSSPTRDIPYEAQVSFFVFPWKIVIGVILFVVFAGIGFYSTLKKSVRKILGIFKGGPKKEA